MMEIQATFLAPDSETESYVEIVIADHEDEDEAEAHVRCQLTVEHRANPMLAEIQIAALRQVRDAIDEQIERLDGTLKERS
jgi:hypothetical protein